MKAQDFMSFNNNRAQTVEIIQEFCHKYGFDYEYTENKFTIKLPSVEPVPVSNPALRPMRKNTPKWDLNPNPTGVTEDEHPILPDELPPIDKPLEEGEAPRGDEEP